jgi:hypothetical protein
MYIILLLLHMCFVGLDPICSPQESRAQRSVAQTVDGEIIVSISRDFAWGISDPEVSM